MNVNGNWCIQNKTNNKKDEYYDVINKYLQKINDQRKKLLILHKEAIQNYKQFKKSYKNVETELELNGECGIISTFKLKEKKNTEERKMKGMLSTREETKKNNFVEHKKMYVKDGGDE